MSYPASMMQRAREHHLSEWNIREIGELLDREYGRRPSETTIRCWVNPKIKARQDAQSNARRVRKRNERNGGRLLIPALTRTHNRLSDEYKTNRMRALRALGLPVATVAKVVSFDFGEEITPYKVSKALAQEAPR